ncbi:MAG: response regulator transcription factor [Deltaproteobacteria bacterium]|jgi:two-component system response regulator NreC|nr:response regulator transcription factor [Deltaproteobacteria bacterium]MBW2265046.1 response regulator transcription factor [Deltaproteobacteria bacterium]MBW2319111.1 response regulator transcription factor [Deltaproteobacteria bacterium]MBW2602344.1 response regulator transcription factor [Deltaproteobacteria bacterium]
MRVLLADDHAIVREGLKQVLDDQQDMEVVGEASDGVEALEKAKSLRPDIVLLDIAMPRLSGLEAVGLIKDAVPDVRIVVLSMHKKEAYVHQVFTSGALGYVLKASPNSEVLEAIRAARRGEYFLSSKIRADVIGAYLESRKERPAVRGYDLLSEREQQVFRLVVEGSSTKKIADVLCVSPKTVEKHRANVMKKLDIHDLVGMVKYAVKIGVVDPDLWQD